MKLTQDYLFVSAVCGKDSPSQQGKTFILPYIFSQSLINDQVTHIALFRDHSTAEFGNYQRPKNIKIHWPKCIQ